MTEAEGFAAWKRKYLASHRLEEYPVDGSVKAAWLAACAWQRQRDAARLAQLEQKRDELNTVLSAWQRQFGTTQLTHAIDRLEVAERKRDRFKEALELVRLRCSCNPMPMFSDINKGVHREGCCRVIAQDALDALRPREGQG